MSVQSKEVAENSELILETLSRILDSAPFRSSKQCQDLLRYVVERSLRQDNEALKERVIGCEVFGRRHDYDTAEDPCVRIRAAEVRKRLALYYRANPENTLVEIDIPHGSYRVVFLPVQELRHGQEEDSPSGLLDDSTTSKLASPLKQDATVPVQDSVPALSSSEESEATNSRPVRAKRRTWLFKHWFWSIVALAAMSSITVVGIRFIGPLATGFDAFWGPIFSSAKGPIIYIGSSAIYRVTDDFAVRYGSEGPLSFPESEGREFVAKFQPGERINASDLIPDSTHFVTIGDTAATATIVSMLSRQKKSYDLRFSDDIVFGDLRRSPTILIGAFNNTWTIEMDDKFPFIFRPGKRIQEVAPPQRSWETVRDGNGAVIEDFALVSRQLNSKSGEAIITVAGIDMTGTRAASEFVCDPVRMNQALKLLPGGWQDRNIQLLLRANIINGLSSSTDVIAYKVW